MDILNCYERNHNDHGTDILIFFIFILHHSVFVAMGYKVRKEKFFGNFQTGIFSDDGWRIPPSKEEKKYELEHFTHFKMNCCETLLTP